MTQKPLKLDLNERSEGAPSWIKAALESMPEETIWQYIERDAAEADLAAYLNVPVNQVLVTNGGDEGILYIFSALKPGTPVHIPLPTFGFYPEQAAQWPVDPKIVQPKDDLSLDIPALRQSLNEAPEGLAVIVRPNNPTGEVIPRDTIVQLLKDYPKTTFLIDEAYVEFDDDPLIDLLTTYSNLLLLRTFSKAWGLAGLRFGYLIGEYVKGLRPRVLPYNVASTTLYLAQKAIENADEMVTYSTKVCANRESLRQWLTQQNIDVYPGKANFLLLRLGKQRAKFVARALKSQGVLVRSFSRDDLNDSIRITIPANIRQLQVALEKVLAPKLLCLDIDGCLLDVHDSFDEVVLALVKRYTNEDADRREILELRAAGGFNDDNVLARELILRRGKDIPLDEIKLAFRDLYFGTETQAGLYLKEKPIIDEDFFRQLQANYHVALVTGRNRDETSLAKPILNFGPDVRLVTVDDVRRGKPDPEGILNMAKAFDTQAVWMVGDNLDDIRAALAANAIAIGVGENRAALDAAGAAIVFENINQVRELL